MARKLMTNRWNLLVVGVLVGLALAVLWPPRQGLATATDRMDNFVMATGVVDDEGGTLHEAVYLLDFQTGELSAVIINRQTGKFGPTYRRRINEDFGVTIQQDPKYLMVTGRATFRREPRAKSCLYVAELKTGQLFAYTFPFLGDQQLGATGDFILLDGFTFRPDLQ